MKTFLFSMLFVSLLLGTSITRGQSVYSDFLSDNEGWVIAGTQGDYQPDYNLTGGNPGGYISGSNALDAGLWVFVAPSKFLGDKSGAYNHSLSFDLLLDISDPQFDDADVTLIGSGFQLVCDLPHDSISTWQSFLIILNENAGWHISTLSGAAPSHDLMINVLSNLSHLEIRGKFSNGTGSGSIDNVYLSVSFPFSKFDNNYEGWRVSGDAQGGSGMPNYRSTGGNPGGHLSATDDVTGGTWYWQAPGKFLGNMSGAYGQLLKFDLKQSALTSQFDNYDVILQGLSFNLVYNTPNNPDTSWTSYSIELDTISGWRIGDTAGTVPTHDQFTSVLSNLQNLYLRGEFIVGDDSGSIDNVIMGTIQGIQEEAWSVQHLLIFPNPASESAVLSFTVEDPGYFTLTLFDETGKPMAPVHRTYCSKGNQKITVPLKGIPSGIYTCELKHSRDRLIGKIIVR
ncbi:MAG: T9SS type A sorting domain-containing protein [Bacteroidetes bacterium]|nr:T9SS type A sorting domain-containing protein [Bacteroidota bacterium]